MGPTGATPALRHTTWIGAEARQGLVAESLGVLE